jgi:hypothetical protein
MERSRRLSTLEYVFLWCCEEAAVLQLSYSLLKPLVVVTGTGIPEEWE